MLEHFHFVHPLWLLALLPLGGLIWLLKGRVSDGNAWRRVVDPHLLPLLLSSDSGRASRIALWLLGAGWLITLLALADPTWEKRPQPLFETQQARVIVLDLSRSMSASDLKPSRLFQARLKIEDILERKDEWQTGLVVFAGDAFGVVPLTRDAKTIRSLLRVLEPDLMPIQGSRVDLGLKQAGELLQQAGVPNGDILLIADGIQDDAAIDQARRLGKQGYRLSVLGIGTPEGAGVPDGQGGTLRDQQGNPVIARLDEQTLRQLAEAGGGRYARLQSGDRDLEQVLAVPPAPRLGGVEKTGKSELTNHAWNEQGPLLAVLLLPLAALAFRRGWLLSLLLVSALMPLPEPATAAWDDLWQRQDQRAAEALARGDAETAARLARTPLRLGSAEYRRNDFQAALQAFAKGRGPEADYNRGNALARLGRYEDAISAYEQALKLIPDMEDARVNKEAIERLLQQQQSEQGQQESADEQQASSDEQKQADDGEGKLRSGSSGEPENQEQEKQGEQPGKDDNNSFARAAEELKERTPEETANGQEVKPQTSQDASAKEDEQPEKQGKSLARPDPKDEKGSESNPEETATKVAEGKPTPLSSEEQMAAEQWLRRIPDDPGGLLRRKFLYQYQRRDRPSNSGQTW